MEYLQCSQWIISTAVYFAILRDSVRQTSWWRLKSLHVEANPCSQHLAKFIGQKYYETEDIDFSKCHVTSPWSRDQRIMWF